MTRIRINGGINRGTNCVVELNLHFFQVSFCRAVLVMLIVIVCVGFHDRMFSALSNFSFFCHNHVYCHGLSQCLVYVLDSGY